MSIEQYFSLPFVEFCTKAGIGQTLGREMIRDGRIRAFRAGNKKLMVDVSSWREYMQRQIDKGLAEYTKTHEAIEARKAKREAVTLESLGLLTEKTEA